MSDAVNNEIVEENITTEENVEHDIDANDETIESEETDIFKVNFTLSYANYIKAQNKTEISSADAAALIASVLNYYENEASVQDVKLFFEIPDTYDNDIEARKYNIDAKIINFDTKYQICLIEYTLIFGERKIPDILNGVMPNIIDENGVPMTVENNDSSTVNKGDTVSDDTCTMEESKYVIGVDVNNKSE